jgi:hypothetical protein
LYLDEKFRKEILEKVGTGFEIPAVVRIVGKSKKNKNERKAATCSPQIDGAPKGTILELFLACSWLVCLKPTSCLD